MDELQMEHTQTLNKKYCLKKALTLIVVIKHEFLFKQNWKSDKKRRNVCF